MNTFDVYTIGGLEYISQVLEAIVLIFGDNTFHTILRVSLLWGLIIAIVIGITKNRTYPLSFLAITFFIFHIFFSAKSDVLITDTKTQQQYYVDNVPFGIALLTSLFSNASYYMANMIDTAFHTGTTVVLGVNNEYVEDMDFKNVGFAGAFNYILSVKKVMPSNPKFVDDYPKIFAYITQCLIPDISTWSEDEKRKLAGSKDIIGSGLLKTKNNLLMEFNGKTWYCHDFYENQAKTAFTNVVDTYINNPELLGIISGAVNNAISQRLPNIMNALTTGQQTINGIIGNQAVKSVLRDAFGSYASSSDVLAQDLVISYMRGEAEARAKLAGKAIGEYAKDTIPLLNIVLQFIIIGIMPMVAIAILIPGGLTIIKNLAYTTAWVYLWTPVLALLDAIVKIGAIIKYNLWIKVSVGGVSDVDLAYNLLTADYIQSQAEWMSAIAGFLAITTPGIAWMVLKGSDYTISSLGSRLGGYMQQMATPETINQAITAERVGYQMTGEFGHGAEVRAAMWGNANSMVTSVAGHRSAIADIPSAFNAAMWSANSNIAQGDAFWKMGGETIEGARALATAGLREKFLQERAMIGAGLNQEWQTHLSENYKTGVNQVLNSLVNSTHDKSSGFQEFDRITTDTMHNLSKVEAYDKSHGTHYAKSFEQLKSFQDSLVHGLGLSEKEAESVGNKLFGVLSTDRELFKGLLEGKEEAFKKFQNIAGKLRLRLAGDISSDKVREWAKNLSDEVKQGITTGETIKELNQLYEKLSKDESFREEWNKSIHGSEGKGYDYSEAYRWSENVSVSMDKVKSMENALSKLQQVGAGYQEKIADMFVDYVKDYYRKVHGWELSDAQAITMINNMRGTETFRALAQGFFKERMNIDLQDIDEKGFMKKWNDFVDYEGERGKLTQEGQQKVEDFSHQSHAVIDAKKIKTGTYIPTTSAILSREATKMKGEYSEQIGATQTLMDGAEINFGLKQKDMYSGFGNQYRFIYDKTHEGFVDRIKDMAGVNPELAELMALSGLGDIGGSLFNLYKNRNKGIPHTTTVDADIHKKPTIHGEKAPSKIEVPETTRSWGGKIGTVAKGVAAATVVGLPAVYFAESAEREGRSIEIQTGLLTPESYVLEKVAGFAKGGIDYVKGFLGGDSNPQQVRTFQSNMYKTLDKR